jgi:N-acetylmuramoyl-L-alanine amidase
MKIRLITITICVVLALLAALQLKESSRVTFSDAVLKYGAKGEDVRELQGRLKHLGYYNGPADGDFGYSTLTSLKRFQSAFGMKADGIAGPKTKLKLWEATKTWAPGADGGSKRSASNAVQGGSSKLYAASHLGLSEQDLKLMANAVYGESRGEPYEGQVAVAAVILNRVKSDAFPNTVSGVIFQPGAFTAVADGQIYLTPNEQAARAVRDALNGWDPTGGCIYYFNPATATSKWIWSRPQVKRIGKHIFCM